MMYYKILTMVNFLFLILFWGALDCYGVAWATSGSSELC